GEVDHAEGESHHGEQESPCRPPIIREPVRADHGPCAGQYSAQGGPGRSLGGTGRLATHELPHSLETPGDKIHSEGSRNNSTGHRGADGHTSVESQNVFDGCVFARTPVAWGPPHGPHAGGRRVRERLAHAAGAG